MNREDCYIGQTLKISSSAGATYGNKVVKVIKVNPRNIKVELESGGILNCSPYFLDETSDTFTPVASPSGAKRMVIGSVVRFKDTAKNKHPLYVILAEYSGAWRIAPLGGDGGRYIRGVRSSSLEVVDFKLDGV